MTNAHGMCGKCKQRIRWIKTSAGKNMPCDTDFVYYKESTEGKDKIITPDGKMVKGDIVHSPEFITGFGYIPHFATCEYEKMFRKKKRKGEKAICQKGVNGQKEQTNIMAGDAR